MDPCRASASTSVDWDNGVQEYPQNGFLYRVFTGLLGSGCCSCSLNSVAPGLPLKREARPHRKVVGELGWVVRAVSPSRDRRISVS